MNMNLPRSSLHTEKDDNAFLENCNNFKKSTFHTIYLHLFNEYSLFFVIKIFIKLFIILCKKDFHILCMKRVL